MESLRDEFKFVCAADTLIVHCQLKVPEAKSLQGRINRGTTLVALVAKATSDSTKSYPLTRANGNAY